MAGDHGGDGPGDRCEHAPIGIAEVGRHAPVEKRPGDAVTGATLNTTGGFVMRGTVSEWQRSLSREGVERLLAGMRAGNDRLDL